jgi:hypothetical protein
MKKLKAYLWDYLCGFDDGVSIQTAKWQTVFQ